MESKEQWELCFIGFAVTDFGTTFLAYLKIAAALSIYCYSVEFKYSNIFKTLRLGIFIELPFLQEKKIALI